MVNHAATAHPARQSCALVIRAIPALAVVLASVTGCSGTESSPPTVTAPASAAAPDSQDVCTQLYRNTAAQEGRIPAKPGSVTKQAEAGQTACRQAVAKGASEREARLAFLDASTKQGDKDN